MAYKQLFNNKKSSGFDNKELDINSSASFNACNRFLAKPFKEFFGYKKFLGV